MDAKADNNKRFGRAATSVDPYGRGTKNNIKVKDFDYNWDDDGESSNK